MEGMQKHVAEATKRFVCPHLHHVYLQRAARGNSCGGVCEHSHCARSQFLLMWVAADGLPFEQCLMSILPSSSKHVRLMRTTVSARMRPRVLSLSFAVPLSLSLSPTLHLSLLLCLSLFLPPSLLPLSHSDSLSLSLSLAHPLSRFGDATHQGSGVHWKMCACT